MQLIVDKGECSLRLYERDRQNFSCFLGVSTMAACAELTEPVSVLHGAYEICSHLHRLENNLNAVDSSDGGSKPDEIEKALGKLSRPVPPLRSSCSITGLGTPEDVDRAETSLGALSICESQEYVEVEFKPVIRSGGCSNIGRRPSMEDEHVRIDDLVQHLGAVCLGGAPGSFYGVFDGHNGRDAAQFVKENLLQFIVQDAAFPTEIEEAVRHGFLQTDIAFSEACSTYDISSGTTVITVFIIGRNLLVANAGDCRAVLCRRGKAVVMSRDHKPCCAVERTRIEALGGVVDDGYLNGQLGVARALGDWHMKGHKGAESPLSGEPEMQHAVLSEADEFMIIGCDGLWDVFSNQNAVDFARKKLQQHNDPELCSRELVDEGLRRQTGDNLTVVFVCFKADPPPKLAPTFRIKGIFSIENLQPVQGTLDRCTK